LDNDGRAVSLEVPRPVPIVSPVVPLPLVPLLIPLPRLEEPSLCVVFLTGLAVAGETAESPVVTVDPVLAFCANTTVVDKIKPIAAITVDLMCSFPIDMIVTSRPATATLRRPDLGTSAAIALAIPRFLAAFTLTWQAA
jgi:hypothetical protein